MYIEVEPEENIKSMLSEFAPFVGLMLESDKGKCRKKGESEWLGKSHENI